MVLIDLLDESQEFMIAIKTEIIKNNLTMFIDNLRLIPIKIDD